MQITLSLSKAEAEAVLRAHLSSGYGVRPSKPLETAEEKLRRAIARAQQDTGDRVVVTEYETAREAMAVMGDPLDPMPDTFTVVVSPGDEVDEPRQRG